MADKEFKDFPATAFASLGATDIFAVQTDVTGARTNKKLTVTEFSSGVQVLINATSLTSLTGTLSIAKGGTGQTTASAAFGALSPLTTKGDVLGFSTVNARLAVGSDGKFLRADSAAATGLSWATLAFSDVSGTLAFSSVTGTVPLAQGGTGQVTAAAAFAALSPLTTKGDLSTYSTTTARLGVGSDGQVLLADSAQTAGIKWGALAFSAITGTVSLTSQAAGTLQAAQFPALTGDVTTSAGSLATSIAANAVVTAKILDANVTLAKMANIATASLIGRATAGTGVPEVLSALPWAFTGDVTSSAGSNALSIAANAVVTAKILDANVTLAKMADVATASVLGRNTAGAGVPEVLTTLPDGIQDNITRLGTIASGVWTGTTIALANGGTGTAAGSANAAFNALSPLTTKGDVLGFSTVNARLAVGSDTQVLTADSTTATGLKWAAASGGSGTPGGSDTQIQYNNAGAFGGNSAWIFTSATPLVSLIAAPAANTAPTAGIEVKDTTAASSGNQQYSPGIFWEGRGWKTTATAASQAVRVRTFVTTIQGSTAPTASWTLDWSINGGAFGFALTYTSSGNLTVVGTITAANTGFFQLSGRSKMGSSVDGAMEMKNSAATAITTLQANIPGSTKTANYTVVTLDSGLAFNNIGAAGSVNFTLPTAAAGMHFWFYVDAAQTLTITAVGSDTIRNAGTVSAAAGTMSSNTVGSIAHIFCPTALKWIVETIIGTWSGPT